MHELYHIDPQAGGIRQLANATGTRARSHGAGFYEEVAQMVRDYLASDPDPVVIDFLRWDFSSSTISSAAWSRRRSGISRPFHNDMWKRAPSLPVDTDVKVEPLKPLTQPRLYTEDDLHIRQFTDSSTRRLNRKGQYRAA